MVIAISLGWSDVAWVAFAVELAYLFGLSLTARPLVKAGLGAGPVISTALAAVMRDDGKLEVSTEADAAARALIASLQDAFNAHDPEAISEHFAEEAAWATVMGQELAGRQEIADFGRSVMPALAESYARYDVTRLLALAPDVVAVRVLQTPVTREGSPADDAPSGAALYVISRRAGAWTICAGQITFVGGQT